MGLKHVGLHHLAPEQLRARVPSAGSPSSANGAGEEPASTWYQEDGSAGEDLMQLLREKQLGEMAVPIS